MADIIERLNHEAEDSFAEVPTYIRAADAVRIERLFHDAAGEIARHRSDAHATRAALGLAPEATTAEVVERIGELGALLTDAEEERDMGRAYCVELRAERDALAAAMAPDEAMRVHLHHCAACASPNDGCDLGQNLEARCHAGGWDVPRG